MELLKTLPPIVTSPEPSPSKSKQNDLSKCPNSEAQFSNSSDCKNLVDNNLNSNSNSKSPLDEPCSKFQDMKMPMCGGDAPSVGCHSPTPSHPHPKLPAQMGTYDTTKITSTPTCKVKKAQPATLQIPEGSWCGKLRHRDGNSLGELKFCFVCIGTPI
jgi:hypothetical protein